MKEALVVRMMLAHNALAGWSFECPGPEIWDDEGKRHTHWPRWVHSDGDKRFYKSQMTRGIEFP